jgi:hypothetical protein
MHRFKYAFAALAVVAFVSPSLAQDASKAVPNAKSDQGSPAGGEVKHDATGGGADRTGSQVEMRKDEPRLNRARAEQMVVGDHHHHRHHRHHHHDAM